MNKYIIKAVSAFLSVAVIAVNLFIGIKTEDRSSIFPSPAPVYASPDTTAVLSELEPYLAINEQVVGWINNRSQINIAVTQSEDYEFYLNHNLSKAHSENGTPFMDTDCSYNSLNTVIYGNGEGIFSSLWEYSDSAYLENNSVIEFSTLYEKGEYEIYAVIKGSRLSLENTAFSLCSDRTHITKSRFNDYISAVLDIASIETGKLPQYGDRLLTLCSFNTDENSQCVTVLAYAKK